MHTAPSMVSPSEAHELLAGQSHSRRLTSPNSERAICTLTLQGEADSQRRANHGELQRFIEIVRPDYIRERFLHARRFQRFGDGRRSLSARPTARTGKCWVELLGEFALADVFGQDVRVVPAAARFDALDVLCQGPQRPSCRPSPGQALQRKTLTPKREYVFSFEHLSPPQMVGSEHCPNFRQQCFALRTSCGSCRGQQEVSIGLIGKCGDLLADTPYLPCDYSATKWLILRI